MGNSRTRSRIKIEKEQLPDGFVKDLMKELTNKEQYCGFLCEEMTEKQQEIVNEIAELRKVNPEFAAEFTGRMVDMLLLKHRPLPPPMNSD
jgi:hypothetical protein